MCASSPTFSISGANDATNPFQLIVTARIVSSGIPQSAITLQADRTPLDHGSGFANALFRGGLNYWVNVTDKSRVISLKPSVRVNYGRSSENDQRKIGFLQFVTVPVSEAFVVSHEITAERMFRAHNHHASSSLGPKDVKPGDRFRLRMTNLDSVGWWHPGSLDGELKDKKFVGSFEEPNGDGKYEHFDDIEGQKPDAETLKRHGWIFSEGLDQLKVTAEEGKESVVIQFVT